MRYEMKDILKTMIDNNEPHWSADTMDMVRVELEHIYAQAAKADEYEAKAEAFDRITEEVKLTKFDIFEKELIDEDTGYLALGKELARFVTKYERIESDEV